MTAPGAARATCAAMALARLRLLGTTAPTARGLRSQRPRNSRLRRNGAKRVDTADMRIVRRRLTSRSDCLLPDLAAVAAGRLPVDAATDRKGVVSGKSGSVRVALEGGRFN